MVHSVNTTPAPREVRIPVGGAFLNGDLVLPPGFHGLVLFAHGSGCGRHSARNRQVAQHLQHAGIATLRIPRHPGHRSALMADSIPP